MAAKRLMRQMPTAIATKMAASRKAQASSPRFFANPLPAAASAAKTAVTMAQMTAATTPCLAAERADAASEIGGSREVLLNADGFDVEGEGDDGMEGAAGLTAVQDNSPRRGCLA
jgi:hypothetical protein